MDDLHLELKIENEIYQVNLKNPIDISIPLHFNGEQPNFFDAPPAEFIPLQAGGFIGDTRLGGSCNVREYKIIPHCNGTHTECVGHIVNQNITIKELIKDPLLPATLITVKPKRAKETEERYVPEKEKNDFLITKQELSDSLKNCRTNFLNSLLIRTMPNDTSKLSRNYSKNPACFLSIEAIEYIISLNVKHLLVDIPSVDRAADQGSMTIHHLYWDVKHGTNDITDSHISPKTITEMISIPDEIKDGEYVLNLQIPAFASDAAPSRPILYQVKKR
jgi:kynurenine formamidase